MKLILLKEECFKKNYMELKQIKKRFNNKSSKKCYKSKYNKNKRIKNLKNLNKNKKRKKKILEFNNIMRKKLKNQNSFNL